MPLKAAWLVDGTREGIARITEEVRRAPIDVGLVGVGENSHIAFNDPPADLNTREAYIIVNLDDRCKRQQVGEGWFATVDDVPKQAVSMTVYQILQCRTILSCVPHAVKADAVYKALYAPQDAMSPAAQLRSHPDWTLYIDRFAAEKILTAGLDHPRPRRWPSFRCRGPAHRRRRRIPDARTHRHARARRGRRGLHGRHGGRL